MGLQTTLPLSTLNPVMGDVEVMTQLLAIGTLINTFFIGPGIYRHVRTALRVLDAARGN